jgi:hypothetical protein
MRGGRGGVGRGQRGGGGGEEGVSQMPPASIPNANCPHIIIRLNRYKQPTKPFYGLQTIPLCLTHTKICTNSSHRGELKI